MQTLLAKHLTINEHGVVQEKSDVSKLVLPTSIESLILSTLDRLTAGQSMLLKVCSCLGNKKLQKKKFGNK